MGKVQTIADHAVEFAAVLSIAALAWAPTSETGALAAAISSVAVGKRYLSGKGKA